MSMFNVAPFFLFYFRLGGNLFELFAESSAVRGQPQPGHEQSAARAHPAARVQEQGDHA